LDQLVPYEARREARKGDQTIQVGRQSYEMVRSFLRFDPDQSQFEDVFLLERVHRKNDLPFVSLSIPLGYGVSEN